MKLLVLQHVPHEHPGYIAEYARDKNIALDIVQLWNSYFIPETDNYDGIIVLGGPKGVYEEFPSKKNELQAIKNAVGQVPILGICLGSQLLAHALGADVHPNIKDGKKVKEVGYYTVDLTEKGKNSGILKGFSSSVTVFQWHGDAFDLPLGADLLATSPLCQNQAFSFKNAYGFLFHFEFTPAMVVKQVEIDKDWAHKDNELDEEVLVNQAKEYASLMKKQSFLLLDNFISHNYKSRGITSE